MDKKYDEALERAKELIEACGDNEGRKRMIYAIFPELVDNKDEEIRKDIIEYLKLVGKGDGDYAQPMINRWIAYLEKQKEHQPNMELIQRSWYMEGYHDREFGKEPRWIIKIGEGGPRHELNPKWGEPLQKEQSITANGLDEEIHRFFDDCIDVHEAKLYGNISERVIPVDCYELTARHFAKWGEKQKEQKPKPYFYCKYGGTIPLCSDCKRNHYNSSFKTEEITTWYAPSNGSKHCIDYIQKEQKPVDYDHEMWKNCEANFEGGKREVIEHPERYGLQKPLEWSEEFEDNIRNLLHDKLTGYSEDGSMSWTTLIDDKTLKDIVNGIWFYVGKEALKYPNKELNVSEWSEEDNEHIVSLLKRLDGMCKKGATFTQTRFAVSEDMDWLKSLPERFNLQPKQEWNEEEVPNEMKQGCGSIDVPRSIKTSRIETLKNLLSYFKWERKSTWEEINTSFIPCLEYLLKDAENSNDRAEWSEEEIGHLYTLVRYIKSKGYEDDGEFLEAVANKLKSLHPQPKQQ